MHSHVYLDESGDLGWKFDAPYRDRGSSRFLTIGYFICPIQEIHIPKRFVKEVYQKFNFNPSKEIKASELKSHHKDFICQQAVKLLTAKPHFHLGAITVKKESVASHVRKDGNTLYYYMMGESLLDLIENDDACKISRDYRSVKVLSGQSCIDYLQTMIFFHRNKATLLTDNPTHSHTDDGIVFIDWITNIVWSKYEDKYDKWCNTLGDMITEKKIYF